MAPGEFWHTRHSCGHSAYWSDKVLAFRTGFAPCPWCGALDGKKVPDDMPLVHYNPGDIYVFREKQADGTVPWSGEGPRGEVILRHRADNSCCTG